MGLRLLSVAERQIAATATAVLVIGLATVMVSGGPVDREAVLASTAVPDYQVVEVRGRREGSLLTVDVVVEGTPDVNGLVAVAARVVDSMRDEHGYNGLRARLYDDEALVFVGPTLGEFIDAPEGEWVKAANSTRDYRLHRTVVQARDKVWEQRPKAWQLEAIADLYQDEGRASGSRDGGGGEREGVGKPAMTAEASGWSEEELTEALHAAYVWSESGGTVKVVLE